MKLLDPNEIKEEKKDTAIQSQKLITALAEEEAKINKEVNLVRENAIIEKENIKKETDEYVARETLRKTELEKEVRSLENRRIQALKPIQEVKDEVQEALNEAKQALVAIEKRNEDLDAFHEENLDLAEDLRDRKVDLDAREKKISSKEDVIKAEESRLKDGMSSLREKWVEFHLTVAKANTDIEKRENKIKDDLRVLDIRNEAQNKREIEQNNHDIAIKDKYAQLEKTAQRIREKKL